MEKISRNQLIVEFNGLPGAGKTTLVRMLQQKLLSRGNDPILSYNRVRYQFRWYLPLFMPSYFSLIHDINVYSRQFASKSKLLLRLAYVYYVKMYRNFVSDKLNSTLLIDQGTIQSLVSLSYQEKIKNKYVLEQILQDSRFDTLPIIIVNCNIDILDSINRMHSRPQREGWRINDLNDNDLQNTLFIQAENFSILRSSIKKIYPYIHMIDIDTQEPLQNNVDKIIQFIDTI